MNAWIQWVQYLVNILSHRNGPDIIAVVNGVTKCQHLAKLCLLGEKNVWVQIFLNLKSIRKLERTNTMSARPCEYFVSLNWSWHYSPNWSWHYCRGKRSHTITASLARIAQLCLLGETSLWKIKLSSRHRPCENKNCLQPGAKKCKICNFLCSVWRYPKF